MKVQKIGLNFKIGSAKSKDISNSKEDELYISRNTKELQAKSEINQIYTNPGIASNLPQINLLNPAYSKQKLETRNINNLKNFRKSTPPGLSSTNTDKKSHFTLDIREEKIKEAKIRLAQGYYSRTEVYSKVAERIIDVLI